MKNAREKKRRDYARERRPAWGNSDKSARKGIPRSKQLDAKAQRQQRRQLTRVTLCESEDDIWAVEANYLSASKRQRRGGFRKWGDISLGEWLEVQAQRREIRWGRRIELRKRRSLLPEVCPSCGRTLFGTRR